MEVSGFGVQNSHAGHKNASRGASDMLCRDGRKDEQCQWETPLISRRSRLAFPDALRGISSA